ncbi:MAG: putative lipoprotein [Phycisphaerales bacterium]|nr:putative lipoprotein [Phycisphaerales bacterium]
MHHSPEAILAEEFIYESAPFPSCHAATLCETDDGLLASYFGGQHERHPDVLIYVSRRVNGKWGEPMAVADGIQTNGGPRQPTWNPVLFQPKNGPLMLFYKVGPSPKDWWGMVKTSDDAGRTWSDATRLRDGIYGPIKNKPIELPDGTIISPCSVEKIEDADDDGLRAARAAAANNPVTAMAAGPIDVPPRRPGPAGWFAYFEISTDGGQTWTATDEIRPPGGPDAAIRAIQPSVLIHSPTHLQSIGRTKSKRLFTVESNDAGRTWGKMTLLDLPNCNSGTDAVTLADARHLVVYNHSDTEKVRYPLNVAISGDGHRWEAAAVLDIEPPGQYSYPAVIQGRDGTVHIAYTWKRQKMKYVALDPAKFKLRPMPDGVWPC